MTILFVAAWVGGCGYGEVVHSWFDHSSSDVPVGAKLPGHVYLLRGVAGDIFSLGMDQLADKIVRRGVTATVHGLSEYRAIAADIVRKYKTGEDRGPIMLIGHSTGGDLIINMAEKLKAADIPVALAIGFDPTRIADDVPSNVDLFINLYQSRNPIGGGEAAPAPGFRGRLIDVDLREHTEIVHITLDKTPAIQDMVAAKVAARAAYATVQAGEPAAKQHRGTDIRPVVLKFVVPRDAPIELWDSAIEVRAKSGDTVESVASASGAPAWAIAQINRIDPGRDIEPGRKLIIPRSFYTDVPEPPIAMPTPVRPTTRVSATKPARQGQKPADNVPAASDPSMPLNTNSFSDRWRVEPTQ